MELGHLIAMAKFNIPMVHGNTYLADADSYIITSEGEATSVIPRAKVEINYDKINTILNAQPLKAFAKYRICILLDDFFETESDKNLDLIYDLIKEMTPYGFHFDVFLNYRLDMTQFYNKAVEGMTYYINALEDDSDDMYVSRSGKGGEPSRISVSSYWEDYTPDVAMAFTAKSLDVLSKYVRGVDPSIRFMGYMLNSELVLNTPKEINFSNTDIIGMLNTVEEYPNFFVGVESQDAASTLKSFLTSPNRVFALPVPGKVTRTYHGNVEGKNGVIVLPNSEGAISPTTIDRLAALGLPVTFVHAVGESANIELVKERADAGMLSNITCLDAVPERFMPGVIRSARMIVAEDYKVPGSYLDMCEDQFIVHDAKVLYPEAENYKLVPIDVSEDEFDETCELIEETYGDIATILVSDETTDVKTSLSAWFHWLFGDKGLALIED